MPEPGPADARSPEDPLPDLPDVTLSPTPLSRGAHTILYRGWDRGRRAEVVAKVQRRTDDAVARERFRREAAVMARLHHPHIVALYHFRPEAPAALVMEYVPGRTLAELVGKDGWLSPARTAQIVEEIAAALDSAHAVGVIHRDVKPDNILLPRRGPARLTDFGVAHIDEDAPLTVMGDILGTIEYASPEQVHGNQAPDDRSDVYSLASVAYFALAATPPFRAADNSTQAQLSVMHRQVFSAPPSLRLQREDLAPEIEAAVLRGLAKAPADRYATAGQFAATLRAATEAASGIPGRRAAAPFPLRPLAWAGAVAGAALFLIAGAALWESRLPPSRSVPSPSAPPTRPAPSERPAPPSPIKPVPAPAAPLPTPVSVKPAPKPLPVAVKPAPLPVPKPSAVAVKPAPKPPARTFAAAVHPKPHAPQPKAIVSQPKPQAPKEARVAALPPRRLPLRGSFPVAPPPRSVPENGVKTPKRGWLYVYATWNKTAPDGSVQSGPIPAQSVLVDGKPAPALTAGGWASLPAGAHTVTFQPKSGLGFQPGREASVTVAPGAHQSRQLWLATRADAPPTLRSLGPAPSLPFPRLKAPTPGSGKEGGHGWLYVYGVQYVNAPGAAPEVVRIPAQTVTVDGYPRPTLAAGGWLRLPAGRHTVSFQPKDGLGVLPAAQVAEVTANAHRLQQIALPAAPK